MNTNDKQENFDNSSDFPDTQMKRRQRTKPVPPPGRRGLMAGEKSRDFKGTMKKLIAYLAPYRWPILFAIILRLYLRFLQYSGQRFLECHNDAI